MLPINEKTNSDSNTPNLASRVRRKFADEIYSDFAFQDVRAPKIDWLPDVTLFGSPDDGESQTAHAAVCNR